jgi:Pyrimidine dimer DNA glycosylase
MNIFALDTDPKTCAEYHVDRHVVKMILEYSQLLSTAHRVLDGVQYKFLSKSGRSSTAWKLGDHREEKLYKATHINHPSAIWARESTENYKWLQSLLVAVCEEYTYRYGKRHSCESSGLVSLLQTIPNNIPHRELTPVRLAMPDEYKDKDFVESYRNYYRLGKQHLMSWKKRSIPEWVNKR